MLLSDAFRIGGLMPAASLETTLELWSTTLRQAKHRIRPLFAAPSVAASAHAFLDGPLGAERRKTGRRGAAGRRGESAAGCEPRRLVIPAPGGSRPSWGAATGTQMLCAMWCATT